MDDNNQPVRKSRGKDSHGQTQRLEEGTHTAKVGVTTQHSSSAAVAAAAEVKLGNVDIFRKLYSSVPTSEKSTVPSVKVMQPNRTVFYPGLGGQLVVVKQKKSETTFDVAGDSTLSVPSPSHTTKSSSLSRDISPSRITAQVVSAMSESSQPLLLSALTGTFPSSTIMRASLAKQDPGKSKQGEVTVCGSSPYQVLDHRHSPLQGDSRVLTQDPNKVGKGPSAARTQSFENLMRAAVMFKAQEQLGQSLPTHLSAGHQPGSLMVCNEGRTRTPSPKSASSQLAVSRSPQQHGGLQGQRRSPMTISRQSPSPNPSHEGVSVLTSTAALSGGVMIMQQMGLVQQHLLATLASTTTTTTTTSCTFSTSSTPTKTITTPSRPGGGGLLISTSSHQNSRLVAAPPVPSLQPSSQLSVSVDASSSAHRVPHSTKNSHVISVGTATERKQYVSHGAQTKVKAEKEEVGSRSGHSLSPQYQKKEVSPVMDRMAGSSVAVSVVELDSSQGAGLLTGKSQAGGSTMSEARSLGSGALSSFSPLSTTAEHHKWHRPAPTSAHSNKPINVPSSHTHIHAPSSLPRPQAVVSRPVVPVTLAGPQAGTASAVTSAPLTQPSLNTAWTAASSASAVLKPDVRTHVGSAVRYQPHHHHYKEHSPPAQTITSQTILPAKASGPVVKDFIPVLEPNPSQQLPPPPPYHHSHNPQPTQSQPANPFTFPTSGIKVHEVGHDNGPAYSLIKQEGSHTETALSGKETVQSYFPTGHMPVLDVAASKHQASDFSHTDGQRESMPRLTPEGNLPLKRESRSPLGALAPKYEPLTPADGTVNHADIAPADTKKQLMSPFNQRLQNLNNFPTVAMTYRSAYRSHSVAMQRAKAGIIISAAKSLDLVRQNIQKSLNREIDRVVHGYIEKFLKPAAENIRQNLGMESVSEEHMHTVCRQMLEEAKKIYTSEARRSITPIADFPDSVSESGSLNGRRVSPYQHSEPGLRLVLQIPSSKRLKASDSDSEKGSDGGLPKKIPRRKGRPPLNSSGRSTPLKPMIKQDCTRDGPKWDPERIQPGTLFVMGARANKALGLGNTRGRLYIRHQDVFKYSGDQEDKVWLHDQKLLPATGGKAYLLLVDDIIDLSKTEEYRDSPNLMMHECRGFQVPDWMRIKIKEAMRALRADSLKRSRSRSPLGERPEPPKSLPFASFSDTASLNDVDSISNKNSLQPSPADTEEMEMLSAMENEDTQPPDDDSTPFKMTEDFHTASPSSGPPEESMDDEGTSATATPLPSPPTASS